MTEYEKIDRELTLLEDEFNAHSPNEQVHVDRLIESIHIIAAAMYELAK